ncbi:barrier-to-autointegration factor [Amia ocellicauda]|uniref:barrier-to-autointegration factor n=1 Tax=Amia ocellicauda TaxID=2972642 RepID=UPI0034644EAA
MSSTSKKYSSFVSEPMLNKSVRAVPGVGDTLGRRLETKQYSQATNMLGAYLQNGGSEEKFTQWMKDTCGANKSQAARSHQALSEWSNNNL